MIYSKEEALEALKRAQVRIDEYEQVEWATRHGLEPRDVDCEPIEVLEVLRAQMEALIALGSLVLGEEVGGEV